MAVASVDPQTGKVLFGGKSLLFWGVMFFLLIFTFILIAFVGTTALVKVTHSFGDQADQSSVEITSASEDGTQKSVWRVFGDYAFIPRSAQAIIAKNASSETRVVVKDLPLFAVPTFDITIDAQRNMSKTGSKTLGCNFSNPHGNFTYGCGSLINISQIQRPDNDIWTTTKAVAVQAQSFSRYQEGFMTYQSTSPQLRYIVPGGQGKELPMPADFMHSASDKIRVITNMSDATATSFVLANLTTGEFLRIASSDASANIARFSRKAQIDVAYDLSTCAINKTELACYYGPGDHDHPDTDEHQRYRDQHPKGQLEITQFNDTDNPVTYAGGQNVFMSTLQVDAGGAMYARNENNLYSVTTAGNNMRMQLIDNDVTSTGISNASLFYTARASIYELTATDSTSHLRFYSRNLTSLTVDVYGDTVAVNAFVNTSASNPIRAYAHSYKLTTTPTPNGQKRKEDLLPYVDLPQATFMDYDDTRMYVALTPLFSTDSSGRRTINEAKTNALQDVVKQRLQKDGLINDQTKFIFR